MESLRVRQREGCGKNNTINLSTCLASKNQGSIDRFGPQAYATMGLNLNPADLGKRLRLVSKGMVYGVNHGPISEN
jgi:hypothetical protein